MNRKDFISSLIFIVLSAFVLCQSFALGIGSFSNPQSGFMLLLIGSLALAFSVTLLVLTLQKKGEAAHLTDVWRDTRWSKNIAVALCLAAYVFFLPQAGYVIATFFLMIFMFWLTSMKIHMAVLGAFLSVGTSYVLFHYLLKTPLPRGFWVF